MTGPAQPSVTPVLLYHSVTKKRLNDPWQVSAADFRLDMETLAATGRIAMTATTYAAGLRGELELPPNPVLVTFDDGFADFADEALPVLSELGLPASLFVTTGWLNTRGMLSSESLRDLASTGSVEIGAHSETHPHLDLLDHRTAWGEISGSRARLEDLTGTPVGAFAFPHGSHRRRTLALVERAGYGTAHAVKDALSHAGDNPYAVARFTVHAGTSRREVAEVIAGRGAPTAWAGERLRTAAFRAVRYARLRRTGMRSVTHPVGGAA